MENLKIIHRKIQVDNLQGQYKFLQITDLHLLCAGATATRGQLDYIAARTSDFMAEGFTPDRSLKELVEYANTNHVTAVLLTGDILDYSSPENLQFLEQALSDLHMPYIYVTGNHDWIYLNAEGHHTREFSRENRQALSPFSGEDVTFHTAKIGEITFVAMDNSADRYLPGTADQLRKVLEEEENVIVLQHVPLYCDTLHEDAAAFWGQDLSLGESAIAPDNSAEEIRRILTASPRVKAVICGHLHFLHEDRLDGVLPQYITAFSAAGNASLFEIGDWNWKIKKGN